MGKSLAYERANALNAICPYFTMFPLEYPLKVLAKHKDAGVSVIDPFCGRGTTLFAARKLGMESCGIDASPIAVAIAKAKLARVNPEGVVELAQSYIQRFPRAVMPPGEFFERAYTADVLRKICSIRKGLLSDNPETDDKVILRAAMLGCLHGPTNKVKGSWSYFSNQMPRTYASKPDYSVRYWKQNHLLPPAVDVLQVLRRKLRLLSSETVPVVGRITDARLGDSRMAASLPQAWRDFSVVVTSPPYYGMRTYVEDQWLRNWFLGGPATVHYGNDEQLEHTGQDTFAKSLGLVWKNMARTKAKSLDMYVRFGIIPSIEVDAKELVLNSLEESGASWKVISVRSARTAADGKRQADQMSADSKASMEYDFHVQRR